MPHLNLFMLGHPRIELDGKPVRLVTRKATALLVYLAVTRESHGRDSLVNLLWPDYDGTRARTVLRRTLYVLNKALSGGWVDADRETIGLNPDRSISTDIHDFRGHLDGCREHDRSAPETCPDCPAPLTRAVDLYHNDFLSGFGLKDSFNFDDWQFFQAQSLRHEFAGALERLVHCHMLKGEFDLSIGYGRRWLELDPLHESAHAQLMRLHAWAGHRSAALRQYDECARTLNEQVGASPLEETTQLYEAIKAGRVPVSPADRDLSLKKKEEGDRSQPDRDTPSRADDKAPTGPVSEENRLVTILTVDAGKIAEGAQRPAGSEPSRLNPFLNAAEDILTRFGGQIERRTEQGIVAAFGKVRTHENDPELAVRAAVELRGKAAELGLDVSAGINTGGVYFRGSGPKTSWTLTSRGHVVNLALRLATEARAGQIWVEESTYRHTRHAFEFTPVSRSLKGIGSPLSAYRVDRLLLEPKKARGIEGLRADLIGRDRELATLREALGAVCRGKGQMVSLIGEAGVGKSRMVSELKANLKDNSEILWLEGRCLEMGRGASYWPFLDILRQYVAWSTEEGEHASADRIVSSIQKLATLGDLSRERAEEMAPLLGNLLSVRLDEQSDRTLKAATPEQMKNQTFVAVRDYFLALASRQPVVLVFEDLHWADSLSLDLISLLMETLTHASLLLLCVYRPDREHKCWHLSTIAERKCPERYTELYLRELTPQQSQRMVESLLRISDLPRSARDLILSKSQGNPFFVEEMVRSLVEQGLVYRQGEFWRAREEIDSIAVPQTVQSVVMGSVDPLEDELKGVLQSASVVGRLFRRRLLEGVTRQETDLASVLLELEDRGLIYEERTVPEEEYSFRHVLTQEAFYQNIPPDRRDQLHREIAQATEALYPDSLDEYYDQLAYHYGRSGHVEKALEYLSKAGDRAKRSGANEEAISLYRAAIEQVTRLFDRDGGRSPEWSRMAARLHEGLGDVLELTGRHEEARTAYHSALSRFPEDDRIPQSRLHRKTGKTWEIQGRYDEVSGAYDRAELALGQEPVEHDPGWWEEWIEVQNDRIWLRYWQNQVEEMAALSERARPALEEHGAPAQRARFFVALSLMDYKRDRYLIGDETVGNSLAAVSASEEADDLGVKALSQFILGFSYLWHGDWDEAEEPMQIGLRLAERTGDVVLQSRCLTYLTVLYRKRGQVDQVRDHVPRCLDAAAAAQMPEYTATAWANLAWVAWREGNLTEAEALGREALGLVEQLSPSLAFYQWSALWPLLGVSAVRNRTSESVDHARALLAPTQMRIPDALAALLEGATRAWESDHPDRTRAELDRVLESARELGYL